jgi:hypothetical protein
MSNIEAMFLLDASRLGMAATVTCSHGRSLPAGLRKRRPGLPDRAVQLH